MNGDATNLLRRAAASRRLFLNRSIALAPIVRSLIPSRQACGLAPRSNKNRLEGWFLQWPDCGVEHPKTAGRHLEGGTSLTESPVCVVWFFGTGQSRSKYELSECADYFYLYVYSYLVYSFLSHFQYPVLPELMVAGVCCSQLLVCRLDIASKRLMLKSVVEIIKQVCASILHASIYATSNA